MQKFNFVSHSSNKLGGKGKDVFLLQLKKWFSQVVEKYSKITRTMGCKENIGGIVFKEMKKTKTVQIMLMKFGNNNLQKFQKNLKRVKSSANLKCYSISNFDCNKAAGCRSISLKFFDKNIFRIRFGSINYLISL